MTSLSASDGDAEVGLAIGLGTSDGDAEVGLTIGLGTELGRRFSASAITSSPILSFLINTMLASEALGMGQGSILPVPTASKRRSDSYSMSHWVWTNGSGGFVKIILTI